jgi:hypothetical protein
VSTKPAEKKITAPYALRQAIKTIPDPIHKSLIARGLAAAKSHPPSMSRDNQLVARQATLMERIEQLREDYAAGKIVNMGQRHA